MRTVGYDVFVDTLFKRLKEKYDVKTLKKVLDNYLSSRIGIVGLLNMKLEFKDQYFGTFRFAEKGFDEYCKTITELMRKREINIDLSHDLARFKIKQEKANKLRWAALNLIDGHLFIDEEKIKQRRKKAIVSNQQTKYLRRKQSSQLKSDRKIRNL